MENVESKNYYELLGVKPDATNEEIKEAYKEIARVYHPDSNFYSEILESAGESPLDMTVFKLVTAAYNVISDPAKRAEYDLTLPKNIHSWEEVEPTVDHSWKSDQTKTTEYKFAKKKAQAAQQAEFGKIYEDEEVSTERPKSLHELMREGKAPVVPPAKIPLLAIFGVFLVVGLATLLWIILRKH